MIMAEEYQEDYVLFEESHATADTPMALLVRCKELASAIWVPKSVIHDDSEVWKPFTNGNLIVSRWWAEKRGLV
jgi:hypothetical protein